jgi:OFA family oxalate/formate antiporter-like MFS transporter
MSNISAIHGITLSAWAFAGLTGNQMATFIVNHVGKFETIMVNGKEELVNPTGYQTVLYVTLGLYIVALLLSVLLVKPSEKPSEIPCKSPKLWYNTKLAHPCAARKDAAPYVHEEVKGHE